MSEITFVSPSNLSTLEQYGAALISGMIAIRTLEAFHLQAFKLGLLDEDEQETGKTICWELQRLLSLYQGQVKNVLDRTEINEDQILDSLRQMMPDVKIPRRRRTKKDGKSL